MRARLPVQTERTAAGTERRAVDHVKPAALAPTALYSTPINSKMLRLQSRGRLAEAGSVYQSKVGCLAYWQRLCACTAVYSERRCMLGLLWRVACRWLCYVPGACSLYSGCAVACMTSPHHGALGYHVHFCTATCHQGTATRVTTQPSSLQPALAGPSSFAISTLASMRLRCTAPMQSLPLHAPAGRHARCHRGGAPQQHGPRNRPRNQQQHPHQPPEQRRHHQQVYHTQHPPLAAVPSGCGRRAPRHPHCSSSQEVQPFWCCRGWQRCRGRSSEGAGGSAEPAWQCWPRPADAAWCCR